MGNNKEHTTVTPESVLAAVKEIFAASREELDKDMKASREEFDRDMKATREEFDREMKETRADFNQRMKKLDEQIGGISNSHGLFAEEYFINSFEKGKKDFFGEKFDRLESNVKGIEEHFQDEYDILLMNGKSVGIVEVKYRAREKDIDKVIGKVTTFKINFPKYQNHRVYLGLAAMTFEKQVEENCIVNGIAVIKQVGDMVVITDEHLKVY